VHGVVRVLKKVGAGLVNQVIGHGGVPSSASLFSIIVDPLWLGYRSHFLPVASAIPNRQSVFEWGGTMAAYWGSAWLSRTPSSPPMTCFIYPTTACVMNS